MLAVAYVLATDDPSYSAGNWRKASKEAMAAWLERLGYQRDD